MIYEDENYTRDKLQELRRTNVCAICGGQLDVFLDIQKHKAYLACRTDKSHEGIERQYEPKPWEEEGYGAFNIPTRREKMAEDLGREKAKALATVPLSGRLSQRQAQDIIMTVWKDAPAVEVYKASMLCQDYGLHPLMKHVHLVKYKRYNSKREIVGEDWSIQIGIGATRLMAHREHNFSYLDDTPRRLMKEEGEKILGDDYHPDKYIYAITKLKDLKTGAEASGVGQYALKDTPKGEDKGNSRLNMACIRSERKAMDRLYPAVMPHGYEVFDERYESETGDIDADYTVLQDENPTDETDEAVEETSATAADVIEPDAEDVGAGAEVSETAKEGKTQKNRRTSAARRGADDITENDVPDGNALQRVAYEVWGIQPDVLWPELNYKSIQNFEEANVESAWDCFLRLKAVRS